LLNTHRKSGYADSSLLNNHCNNGYANAPQNYVLRTLHFGILFTEPCLKGNRISFTN
jgi:hypothetical protein